MQRVREEEEKEEEENEEGWEQGFGGKGRWSGLEKKAALPFLML